MLILTGIESGYETGVAGDRYSWWHCHCCFGSDCGLPEKRHFFFFFLSTLSLPANVLSSFLMTGCVNLQTLSPTGQRKWPISKMTRTDALPYHLTFVPLPSQVRFNFISLWSTDGWKSLIFSKPAWAPPRLCGLGGPVRAWPAATAERGVIYIFIRISVLLAGDSGFWL